MTNEPLKTVGERPTDDELLELRVKALHGLIGSAQEYQPDFATRYVSFLRFLREQLHPIGIRDIRRVDFSTGLTWSVDVGDRLGADFYYGYWGEFLESELFLSVLRPGDVVIDVGANFGYYTISSAVKIGAQGVVHAFEADPFAFQLLRSNVSANALVNAQCHNVCIAATDGETPFHVMTESAFSGISATGRARLDKQVLMKSRALDSILGSQAHDVAAMKIDVEGHEGDVLQGAHETILRSNDAVLMVEVSGKNLDRDRRATLQAALERLYAEGLRGWVIDGQEEGLRRLTTAAEAMELGAANLFLARDRSSAETRLRDAARGLRAKASSYVFNGLRVDDTGELRRNGAALSYAVRLHTALVGALLQERETRIRAGEVLLDSERAHVRALEQHSAAIEKDSQARLAEIGRLAQQLDALETNRRAQVAEIERLRQQVEHWKDEASLGVWKKVWRQLR